MKSRFKNFFYLFNIKKNILSRLFVALIIIMFISLLAIMFIWNNSIHKTINNLSLSHVTDVVKNANSKLENDLHDLFVNLETASNNHAITEYFFNPDDLNTANLEQYLRDTYDVHNSNLKGIALITEDKIFTAGTSYFPENIRESEWYRSIIENNGNAVIVNLGSNPKSSLDNYFTNYGLGMLLKHKNAGRSVLLFSIAQQFLSKNFDTNDMNGSLNTIIIDENKNIVFSNAPNIKKEQIDILSNAAEQNISNSFKSIDLQGEKYLMTAKRFASRPKWTNITFFPKNILYKNYLDTISLTVCCMVILTFIAVLTSYIISSKLSKKIQNLSSYIDNIDFTHLTVRPEFNLKGSDEIDNIYIKINQMVDTIANQINTISELEEKRHAYEMQSLKAQINPHLIYNTLNAIQSLAEIQNSQNISAITKSLSELLQYSVDSTDSLVPLADEIQYIKNYVQIMQHKFLNKINLVINIEEDLSRCLMLKMTLQPIVENSLKHGLRDVPNEYIMIKAYRSETGVSIKIIDNGVGIEPDILNNLLKSPDENSSHIGLNNINRRIKLTFGEEYGISIYSTVGIQTTVIIDIPYLP